MNVLQKVHHPHTVQFFGAVTKRTPYMIITEFMACGSMADMFRCVLCSCICLSPPACCKAGADPHTLPCCWFM